MNKTLQAVQKRIQTLERTQKHNANSSTLNIILLGRDGEVFFRIRTQLTKATQQKFN